MNRNIMRLVIMSWTFILVFYSCTPDNLDYHDNSIMEINSIDSVALVANHVMLLADGNAKLEFVPKLFTKDKNKIPAYRVDYDYLEFVSESGEFFSQYFSTNDLSRVGETVYVKMKVKDTDLESNAISFKIVEPLETVYQSDIIIPVVFHIIQTNDDVVLFGGAYKQEQIDLVLNKLNNMLSGVLTHNPVGVNTHVQLKAAIYDPYGKKLKEAGINRLTVENISTDNYYEDFLSSQHLIWNPNQYMNIWLISDREQKIDDFANDISEQCVPSYVLPETGDILDGLICTEYQDEVLLAREAGIIFKLQELDNMSRGFFNDDDKPVNNELGYYVGRYLGLLPTCTYASAAGTDYCVDTHDYFPDMNAVGENKTWYKEANGCYFRAENIMDDPRGVHSAVSKEQCKRMRWVLEHCVGRLAWKSNFAFVGQNN